MSDTRGSLSLKVCNFRLELTSFPNSESDERLSTTASAFLASLEN